MILGLTTATYTLVHVLLSLIGLAAGFVVLYGLLSNKRFDGWTALFLATTILTSVTGFGFPTEKLLPSQVIGALSLIVLSLAVVGRYLRGMEGAWRRTYVISAMVALYFNTFVAVVQSFRRIPLLQGLAPTQSEPPFAIAQLVVLIAFVVLGYKAVKQFSGLPLRSVAPFRSDRRGSAAA